MQKTRRKLVNCKALINLSRAFSKLTRKIKTVFKPSKHTAVGSKQKKRGELKIA
jgi:hypothetical protein